MGQRATLQNDIVAKVFDKRWGEEMTLLKAGKHDNGRLFSFGDAATAYDAQTGRILLMCAIGIPRSATPLEFIVPISIWMATRSSRIVRRR